jgi:hypothetical protein
MRGGTVVLAALLAIPAALAGAVALAAPRLGPLLPAPVEGAVQPIAAAAFALLARLPADSLPGAAFYGSYAALVPFLGASALAVHALLWGAPWAGAAWWVSRHRPHARRAS